MRTELGLTFPYWTTTCRDLAECSEETPRGLLVFCTLKVTIITLIPISFNSLQSVFNFSEDYCQLHFEISLVFLLNII